MGLFDDGNIWSAIIQTGAQIGSQYFGNEAKKDAQDQAAKDNEADALKAIELERLKYQYGLKGGAGGGKGGGGVDPRLLQIQGLERLMSTNSNNSTRTGNALTNLATLMQNAYLGK